MVVKHSEHCWYYMQYTKIAENQPRHLGHHGRWQQNIEGIEGIIGFKTDITGKHLGH